MVQSNLSHNVNPNPAAETEPGYGQIFAVLIRRFPWFLAVLITSIAIAGVITKNTPKQFKSSMQLQIEPNYQGRSEGGGGGQNNDFTNPYFKVDIATQLNLMRSSGLIKKAEERLRSDYPEITLDEIQRSLVLTQIKDKEDNVATKIIKVDFSSTNPVKTQKVLDAIQEVYLEYNKEQQKNKLENGLIVIKDQLKKVEFNVKENERRLLQFRTTQKLTDPETQAKALQDALGTIQQQRRAAAAQLQEAVARYNSLEQQLKRTPQTALVASRLTQSTRYQGLLNEIQKTELALAQERLRFTDEAPVVKKLIEQLQSHKQLLQQEVGRTLGDQAAEVNTSGGDLLQQGQLSQIDITLAGQLVETRTNISALRAGDETLKQKEELLSRELQRYPQLLDYYNNLQPQIRLGRDRLQELLRAEQQLRQELSKGGFQWQVVEAPQPGFFVGPNLQQNLMLGAVVGLVLGGIAAFVRESSDDSVHTTAELEKQAALPLLGTTPKLPAARTRESVFKLPFGKPEVLAPWTVQVMQSPPRWESLDLIFKNIELMNTVSTFKSLMITSALPDDGKSAMALGLAMSAARLHKKVLLIDANLRSPSLHKQLNLPNEQGLSTLLANDLPIPNQFNLHSSGSSYIDILTAGPAPADPANLLSSPRMQQLMATFEQNYDLVLVDASPVLGLVDAMLTASSCRSVVMVASIGKVTRTHLAQATAMMSRLNLIGVVASGVSNGSTYVPYASQQRLALLPQVEK